MFKTRFFSILALLFGLLPCMSLTAYAASVSYVDGNGTSQTVDATELESTTTSWTDGSWYIVPEGGLTISGRIEVSGTVNLILRDGAELTASEGITTTGATLNIYAQSTGTGALTATGNNGNEAQLGGGSAGIGGNGVARDVSGGAGGTVNIYGGTVTATGGNGAKHGGGGAGIGGGGLGYKSSGGQGGTVNIYGGTVTATGGNGPQYAGGGAGIGGGGNGYRSSAGADETVNIYGGTVTATGGTGGNYGGVGAGIGGGGNGYNSSAGAGGTLTLGVGVKLYNGTDNTGTVLDDNDSESRNYSGSRPQNMYAEVTVAAPAAKYDLTLATGSDAHGTVAFTVGGSTATQAKKDDVVTVSVTPNDGYSAKDVTVRAYTSWEAASEILTGGGDNPGLVSDITVTKNETDGTWQFTMPEANVWIVVTYAKNLQNAWIQTIADQTYTGSAITPTVTVMDGETTLVLNTDYTVAYSNNVETGTATVTVTGTGNYSGTATANFTIVADKSALNTAITEAETYYNSIKDDHAEAAAALKTAIDTAKGMQEKGDATQEEVNNALSALTTAKTTAEDAVLTETKNKLNDDITAAETYYNSIKDDHADAANTLKEAIDAAKGVKDNADATKEQVDAAIAALASAKTTAEQTVLTETKTALNDDITDAEAYYNSIKDSNPTAAATLLEAINTAKAVKDNTDATQEQVDAAIAALASAKTTAEQTVLTETKTALNDDITDAEAYYNSIKDSNPTAAATLLEAINTAKAVKDNTDATQEQVDAAIAALASAKTTAEQTVLTDTKDELYDDITEAEAYYNSIKDSNPAAAATLLDAINTAKTVKDNADATQEQVDAAIAALASAKTTAEQTVLTETKNELNDDITEAEAYYNSIKDSNPTAAATLLEAINTAKAVKDNTDATQEQVDAAIAALASAKTTAEQTVLTETKDELNDDITEAEAYYNSIKDSNPTAAATLLEAINAAKAVKDNTDATQEQVDAAIAALASAKTTAEQTVLTETKNELNDDITEAEAYYNSIKDSNPTAAATLLEAINAAKAVKDNTDATQEQVDAAIAALASAKTTAEQTVLTETKDELNDDITEAEAYYNSIKDSNPTAAATLLEAINAAKAVKDNADATQSEIETAAQTLTDALNAAKADVALKRITLTIPAKSYMARIDADKRQIETAVAGVKLYSVKSVTNTEVELTAELSVIAAEMPYFIYNDNDTEVEVSIIVSSNDPDNVAYDSDHFKGTLVDKTFTDEDMEEADHYVLSGGSSFVWVKDAGVLSAGKCWIELIPTSAAHARRLSIVHEGETTGISTVKTTVDTKDAAVYDLQGRRVMQPTKGLFIVNGKKVVIK